MGRGQPAKGGRRADSRRRGDSYQRKSTLDASVLGLGGGAVLSLGGGAMNLASLLGGVLQTQINPLEGVLGGYTTGLLGMSGAFRRIPRQQSFELFDYPRRGVSVRESPALLVSRKQHSYTRWHN